MGEAERFASLFTAYRKKERFCQQLVKPPLFLAPRKIRLSPFSRNLSFLFYLLSIFGGA
jgi:hypothetical protein